MPVRLLHFREALANAPAKRHLLLGNGFSIALKPDIFSYTSLYDRANFAAVPCARAVFDALATRDFEAVIKVLVSASKLLKAYTDASPSLIKKLERDASQIKNILVSAIAENHPDRPFEITSGQYVSCRQFLSNFDHIYTLNYDVLLYWAMMQDEVDELDLQPDDGFRHPEDDPDAPYVSWQEAHSATVHYIHGALHLFDAGSDIIKYTWSKTDIPILDQIRAALDTDRYPLFVSEGDNESKLQKILHNGYLHKGYRSFRTICDQKGSCLFLFGHSLAENDDHILKRIARGKIGSLFVSIYGDPDADSSKWIIKRARALSAERAERNRKNPLTVEFFSSSSAEVWGPPPPKSR